jgi:mRNA-degrading endonuclease RelE of RelBE toxin-antitoxin system
MSYKVSSSKGFRREVKPLSKKYRSLKGELATLFDELAENPTLGESLGRSCYKIRLGIASKGKGKRGGARIVTYVIAENEEVILLTIYDKAIKEDLLPNELNELLGDLSD